jgi:hypothetical protein
VVPKDRVRTLVRPPPFPQSGVQPPFRLPASVDIVTLLPPPANAKDKHILQSERKDINLFQRVSEYFHRFYVPQYPNKVLDSPYTFSSSTSSLLLKAILEKVEVIFNAAMEEQFRGENETFEKKFRGLVELRGAEQSDIQQKYLTHILTRYLFLFIHTIFFLFLFVIFSKNLIHDSNANPISAWHGTAISNLNSICWYGLLNLTSNDPGTKKIKGKRREGKGMQKPNKI